MSGSAPEPAAPTGVRGRHRLLRAILLCAWCALTGAHPPVAAAPSATTVSWVRIDGVISSFSAEYLAEAIRSASAIPGAAVVIELDTPGGLLDATRAMVKSILGSPVPVVVWVGPDGARAASAGTFITLAAHIAAMAPATNIGAAHPVQSHERLIPTLPGEDQGQDTPAAPPPARTPSEAPAAGGDGAPPPKPAGRTRMSTPLDDKVLADTLAWIRGIAARRGRNVTWAEQAVRDSRSSTAAEALELGVIDFIAPTPQDLLRAANGRSVEVGTRTVILDLEHATIAEAPASLAYRVLRFVAHPNVAYVLLILGFWGLFFEISHPGVIFPGIFGSVCLVLAFLAFQVLPINFAGILFLLLAMALFVAEAMIVSHGLLAAGGILCLALGSILLYDSRIPALRVDPWLIASITGSTAAIVLSIASALARAARLPPRTGLQDMVGATGTVVTRIAPEGQISTRGELWRAVALDPTAAPMEPGQAVRVASVQGLTLLVTAPNHSTVPFAPEQAGDLELPAPAPDDTARHRE
ncbi:MAG: nodulation protein NfeD [Candidatus Schekmanbacteria bacterium]|nr:nodulation protein NfeD [Candidatus Schekmanbacteria bacterium]